MKAIIIGAGELGRLLASTLCAENHDVVVIDSSSENFERLKEKLDLMVIEGSCSDVSILKQAGIQNCDTLIAVSGDEAANILACKIAGKFGVKKTICRFYTLDCFSSADGITPEFFGIWRAFSPPEQCVRKIIDTLGNPICLEKIQFTNPDALMEVISITPSSMLAGARIKDIPVSDALSKVRFAAIVRDRQFLIPHGDTVFVPGDKVYVAGKKSDVDDFVEVISPSPAVRSAPLRIIISGATATGTILARELLDRDIEVRFIEKSELRGERLLDSMPQGMLVIKGDPTDEQVMEEAGIQNCDAFVAAADDDEENILACIMAKRLGAKKTISVTHKPEYIRIVPTMEMIDSGISSTLVSVNLILRILETGTMRIDAKLQRFHAHLTEFTVSAKSPLAGKAIMECKLPSTVVLALLFRGADVIPPAGTTVLLPGDVVVAIVNPKGLKDIEPLFPK